MGKTLVLYHGDCCDGFCAAWIAKLALGDIDTQPVWYGQSPPDVKDRDVLIVDFSYPRDVLMRMQEESSCLTIIDHHKTAQQDLEGLPFCTFDMNKSGARLTWEGWYGTEAKAPWLVDYTEDRDLWRHQLPESKTINAALRSYPLDFTLWTSLSQRSPFELVPEGKAILRSEQQIVENHVRNACEVEMAGYKVLVVNATVLYSEIAGRLSVGRPFGACYFDRKDKKRQWSLRSSEDGVDVSEIAKAHGGGGHKHAAGFEQ